MNLLSTRFFSVALLAAGILPLSRIDACGSDCPNDADGDGVCDAQDACPGYDDNQDADGDTQPDACDACPQDAPNDVNGDGICDGAPQMSLAGLPGDMAVIQRDAGDLGQLTVSGSIDEPGYDEVILEVDQDGIAWQTLSAPLTGDGGGTFSLEVALPAGLINYTMRLSVTQGEERVRAATRTSVAVGDLVLIQGQSNAVAGDYYGEGLGNQSQSPWIRSFGSSSTDAAAAYADVSWHEAEGDAYYTSGAVGQWGLRLGEILLEQSDMPIGMINGAVGGTYISQHQRNDANPEDLSTIYGRFLYRARLSDMAAHARLMVWYQGESDGYGWGEESNAALYLDQFAALRSDWKADFAALEQIYVFQVRNGCGLDHPSDASLYTYFNDAAGNLLGYDWQDFWAGPSWTRYAVTATAPAGTAYVTYWFEPWAYGAVDFDDASASGSDGLERLLNPGFETGSTQPDSWVPYGSGYFTWLDGVARSGTRSVGVESASAGELVYQVVAASPGETITESIWARAEYTGSYFDIREVLRTLPGTFDDVKVMSTNGAPDHDGCHFLYDGYRALGDRIGRLIVHDFYGVEDGSEILAPEATAATLEADGTIHVRVAHVGSGLSIDGGIDQNFRLAGAYVTDVQLEGTDTLKLTLSEPTDAATLAYTDRAGESADVLNSEGVGMLSFVDLPISR